MSVPIFAPRATLALWRRPIRPAVTVAVWVDAPDAASALQLAEELNALGKTEIVALENGAWQTTLSSQHERREVITAVIVTVGRWASTQGLRKARVRITTNSDAASP